MSEKETSRVLVVDDEHLIRRALTQILADSGYQVLAVASGEEAVEAAVGFRPDVALLDLQLGGMDGVETMEAIREAMQFDVPVFVIVTAHGSIPSAVDAIKRGASDYVTKPFGSDELDRVLRRSLEYQRLQRRVHVLEDQLQERFSPRNLIGHSDAMKGVFRIIERIGPVDTTLLITGESGTGKELVARATHRYSKRRDRRFVAVNCGAIPPTLLETTFFGHESGAFTDAKQSRRGAFEQAHGGTLFLDEVGELSSDAQVRLLRVLESGEVTRVGAENPVPVDVRVIAATNRDLAAAVQAGQFREDLYWRLNVVSVRLPALRARPEDIPAFVDHFISRHSKRLGVAPKVVSTDAMAFLLTYPWPGNVRELENVLEHALVLSGGAAITAADLPARIKSDPAVDGLVVREPNLEYGVVEEGPDVERGSEGGDWQPIDLLKVTARVQQVVEWRLIRDALRDSAGKQTGAARRLGINRRTLFKKMRALGLDADGDEDFCLDEEDTAGDAAGD